ncbi:T3SS effector HopA1 family protein [Streptomyces pseudovenezuelae]|uniref:T3SS effector HopA1 family protein n=1 Tax=Streptomyces pseudovenezuelae TaxID=67350 RepID=UPI002E80683C|nr:T3SS effector HopA1 family protein [Streptomyces pseudovenezuelae]WUA85910.1 T3SS effector HopA1 family protein [Streptomyces pseudovenezuelae]
MPLSDDVLLPELQRVLEKVELRSDAMVAHIDGHKLEGNSPRHLSVMLRWGLYEFLHAGRAPDTYKTKGVVRDGGLEAELTHVMPHRDTVTSARVEGRRDGELLVSIDGTRVWVPEERRIAEAPEHGDGVVYLSMPAARPALSPGFFLADGTRGRSVRKPILRVYVHLRDIDVVPAAWAAVLHCLEDKGVTYRAKVSSSPLLLPRRDALVVFLGPDGWDAALDVVEAVDGLPGIEDEVSVFARRLAPGVSTAWHPFARRTRGPSGLSFGQHRATAVAQGLVDHALGVRGGSRSEVVAQALREAGVDPAAPFRNEDSPRLDFAPTGPELTRR